MKAVLVKLLSEIAYEALKEVGKDYVKEALKRITSPAVKITQPKV